MDIKWVEKYLLSKKGVQKDYKEEWKAIRYLVKDKMFIMIAADNQEREIITIKLEPSFGELLKSTHTDVVPGYYMNKQHWVSIYLDTNQIDSKLLQDILDQSYLTLIHSFTKKLQKELLEED